MREEKRVREIIGESERREERERDYIKVREEKRGREIIVNIKPLCHISFESVFNYIITI